MYRNGGLLRASTCVSSSLLPSAVLYHSQDVLCVDAAQLHLLLPHLPPVLVPSTPSSHEKLVFENRISNIFAVRKISEVRSGTHNNGGRNPDWTRKNNFFTFYVPSNVALERLAVVLEVYDSNTMSDDKMIGTCGKIPLKGVRRFQTTSCRVSSIDRFV